MKGLNEEKLRLVETQVADREQRFLTRRDRIARLALMLPEPALCSLRSLKSPERQKRLVELDARLSGLRKRGAGKAKLVHEMQEWENDLDDQIARDAREDRRPLPAKPWSWDSSSAYNLPQRKSGWLKYWAAFAGAFVAFALTALMALSLHFGYVNGDWFDIEAWWAQIKFWIRDAGLGPFIDGEGVKRPPTPRFYKPEF
eukprot:Hpha_TRINITY_DN28440_c0_g1::TRINITY_DN28440_c0_g1_i1::g.183961::m.183961